MFQFTMNPFWVQFLTHSQVMDSARPASSCKCFGPTTCCSCWRPPWSPRTEMESSRVLTSNRSTKNMAVAQKHVPRWCLGKWNQKNYTWITVQQCGGSGHGCVLLVGLLLFSSGCGGRLLPCVPPLGLCTRTQRRKCQPVDHEQGPAFVQGTAEDAEGWICTLNVFLI